MKLSEQNRIRMANSKSASVSVIIRFKDQSGTKKETLENVYLCISYTIINYKDTFCCHMCYQIGSSIASPFFWLDLNVGAAAHLSFNEYEYIYDIVKSEVANSTKWRANCLGMRSSWLSRVFRSTPVTHVPRDLAAKFSMASVAEQSNTTSALAFNRICY